MPTSSRLTQWCRAAVRAVAGAAIAASSACAGSGPLPTTLPAGPDAHPTAIATPAAVRSTAPRPATHRRPLTGPGAVVRRYYAVLNGLHRDMNAAGLARLFTANCPCRVQAASVRIARARGEHYIDHVTLRALTTNIDGPGVADVLVAFDAARGGLVDRQHRHVTSAPAQRGLHRDFELVRRRGRWLIYRLVVV